MAATVTIRRWTGSSGAPTKTNITSINTRANAEDAHSTAGTSNSILIPTSGTNYSYWVATRLSVDASQAVPLTTSAGIPMAPITLVQE